MGGRSVSLPSHPDLLAEKLQTRSILTLHLVSFQGVRSARAIEAQGFAVAPVRLVNRVAYARSLMVGQVAQEFRPNDKAAKEAAALHTFVCTHLYASRKETRTDGRKAKLRRGA